MSILNSISDPVSIIKAVGLAGIFFIVFAESGLFFGFFFPGDSLLFTAGFLASQGLLPSAWLFIGIFLAAVLGDSFGYTFGRHTGASLFTKEDSLIFNKKYPHGAKKFLEKYGGKTIIFARFIPVVRTFAPIIAGVGSMDYREFLTYNVVGAAAWTMLITGGGFFLGHVIPHADRYITAIVLVIIAISCIPIVYHFLKEKMSRI